MSLGVRQFALLAQLLVDVLLIEVEKSLFGRFDLDDGQLDRFALPIEGLPVAALVGRTHDDVDPPALERRAMAVLGRRTPLGWEWIDPAARVSFGTIEVLTVALTGLVSVPGITSTSVRTVPSRSRPT